MFTLFLLRSIGYLPHRHLISPGVRSFLSVLALTAACIAALEAAFFARIVAELTGERVVGAGVGMVWAVLTFYFDRYIALSDVGTGKAKLKVTAGMLLRAAGMALLFLVVAPQVRFFAVETEVRQHLQQQRDDIRANWLTQRDKDNQRKVTAAKERTAELESKLTLEISGKGLSGRHGEGPTAKSIREQLLAQRAEYERLRAHAETERQTLKTSSDEELTNKYGVSFPVAGMAERRRIGAELLRRNPAYEETATLAKSLVAVLFLIFMATKLLQGAAVSRYLSEVWQSRYRSYLSGAFNAYLSIEDQPTSTPMDAARFVEWYEANPEIDNSRNNPLSAHHRDENEERLGEDALSMADDLGEEIEKIGALLRTTIHCEAQCRVKKSELKNDAASRQQRVNEKYEKLERLRGGVLLSTSARSECMHLELLLLQEIDEETRQRDRLLLLATAAEQERAIISQDQRDLRARLDDLMALQRRTHRERDHLRERKLRLFSRRVDAWVVSSLRKEEPVQERILQ